MNHHLWQHFTPLNTSRQAAFPVIVGGEGCYVWDEDGRRYLDGLSALFCVNAGHGRVQIAEAIASQAHQLDFYTNWSFSHPGALELASRIADLAPGDLNRVFFVNSGSEAVEAAIKLARQYYKQTGRPRKTKFLSREISYHGSTLGALTATGIPALREPFLPLVPSAPHVANTNVFRRESEDPASFAAAVERRIEDEDPDTVAAVLVEPLQCGGGCIVPPPAYFAELRAICDRHDVLLISDEVICAWGRIGHWFGCERFGFQPDLITVAKSLTNAAVPMGGLIVSDRVTEPFLEPDTMFKHGSTFGGHPLACAAALANLDLLEATELPARALEREQMFTDALRPLCELPIVGDMRGVGYLRALELVRNPDTNESLTEQECDRVLHDFLSEEFLAQGLICRADDRGDPVITLAPPLTADAAEFATIASVLHEVLEAAYAELHSLHV
jgi:adenosylmethionine-8-amino-7-oxononanoate aminotransferase